MKKNREFCLGIFQSALQASNAVRQVGQSETVFAPTDAGTKNATAEAIRYEKEG
jgi:hypothetical protein